jgi:hypothetical protein
VLHSQPEPLGRHAQRKVIGRAATSRDGAGSPALE